MPVLRNAKHERFARELALGVRQAEAWETASGRRSRQYASALANLPHVRARIAELRGEHHALHGKKAREVAEPLEISRDRVARELAKIAFGKLPEHDRFEAEGIARAARPKLSAGRSMAAEAATGEEPKPDDEAPRPFRRNVELDAKRLALMALARHLGMFDNSKPATPTVEPLPLKNRIKTREEWLADIASRGKA